MHAVGKNISFTIVVGVILGWGILLLMIFKSSLYLFEADTSEAETSAVTIIRPIKFTYQTDKKVYAPGEKVLLALRNDSRRTIWLQGMRSDAVCANAWWQAERLGDDGQTWTAVKTEETSNCISDELDPVEFSTHTIKSGSWIAVSTSGTHRFTTRYLAGLEPTADKWASQKVRSVSSPTFTIQ